MKDKCQPKIRLKSNKLAILQCSTDKRQDRSSQRMTKQEQILITQNLLLRLPQQKVIRKQNNNKRMTSSFFLSPRINSKTTTQVQITQTTAMKTHTIQIRCTKTIKGKDLQRRRISRSKKKVDCFKNRYRQLMCSSSKGSRCQQVNLLKIGTKINLIPHLLTIQYKKSLKVIFRPDQTVLTYQKKTKVLQAKQKKSLNFLNKESLYQLSKSGRLMTQYLSHFLTPLQ